MAYVDVPGSEDRTELPVACTLGPTDGAERMRRWKALVERTDPTTTRVGAVLEVDCGTAPGVIAELRTLAAAERECCSFVNWTVVDRGGRAVLVVTARADRPDDIAAIAALF